MWQTVASGNSGNVPPIGLESGVRYRLIMNLPVEVPDWLSGQVVGAINDVLSRFGLNGNIEITGSVITVNFQT